jgi:hypothetical protein
MLLCSPEARWIRVFALLLFSCSPEDPAAAGPDPVAHLVRASMVVRGTRPTVAELEAVERDPAALRGLVRAWMESEPFRATIRDMWAEILLIRNDTFLQLPALGLMEGYDLGDIYLGTVEEPLKLVEHVVSHDLPLTELVTAQYMLTDEVTATIYGVPYDFQAGGWQLSEWPDERPRAGLLSSAQLWRRWESNGSNFHRGRANMIAGRFLCEDFESRDIVVDGGIDIADEEEVARAVLENPGCISCHQAMDPLAGFLWGYKRQIHRNYVAESILGGCEYDWSEQDPMHGPSYLPEDHCYPLRQYVTADEDDWLEWGLREPGYYGAPARDLADVGQQIATDPRFSECMARQFQGWITQTDAKAVPFEQASAMQQVLEQSSFSAKALVEAIVLSEPFARGTQGGLLAVRPEQYARAIEDLTGFRWWSAPDALDCDDPTRSEVRRYGTQCWGDVDLSDSDVFGFRAMSGGVDGKVVLRPTRTVTPTKTLVMAQLAANAAGAVVDSDLSRPALERRLLSLVEPDTTDEAAVRAQIAWLHARVLGQRDAVDSAEVDNSYALFVLGAGQGPAAGWKVLLTAMFQDPQLMFY